MSALAGDAVVARFGTQWRWRAVLILISVVVFAAGWNVARWWSCRVIVQGSGETAVIRVRQPGLESLEHIDWSTGTRRKIAEIPTGDYWLVDHSVRVVRDGKAVAWRQDDRVHIAPIDGSGVKTSARFKLNAPSSLDPFLGVTSDENYAVFCVQISDVAHLANGTSMLAVNVTVVDLRTGEYVSAERWAADTCTIGSSAEIVGTRLNPEAYGRWTFSSDPGWKKVAEDKERLHEHQIVFVSEGADGQLSWTGHVTTQKSESWGNVVQSPSGECFVANSGKGRCAVFNDNTGKVTDLSLPWGCCPTASFTADGKTLVVSDLLDDIQLIDAETGRLIAKDTAGSDRRMLLLGFATIGLLLSVAWFRFALLEHSTSWAMVDALATTLAVSFTITGAVTAATHPGWSFAFGHELFGLSYVVAGIAAGAAVMTGCYWAHGDGALVARWIKGAICLALLLTPLPMLNLFGSWWQQPLTIAATAAFAGGVTALVVWLPNLMGWTIRNRPIEGSAHRFGLGAIFGTISSVGILLALGRWLIDPSRWESNKWIVDAIAELMCVGTLLVAVFFLRLPWYGIVVALLVAAAAITTLICLGLFGMAAANPKFVGAPMMEVAGLIGTTLSVAISCTVLRRHGFRWTRGPVLSRSPSVVHA